MLNPEHMTATHTTHSRSFLALASRFSLSPLPLPLLLLLLLPLLLLLFSSCTRKAEPDWSQFLPDQTVLVYWGESDLQGSLRTEIGELIGKPMIPSGVLGDSIIVNPVATALVPESVDQLSALWIFDAAINLKSMLSSSGWVSKGGYSISEGRIEMYAMNGMSIAVATSVAWTLASEGSRTIEQALRAADGSIPRMEIENRPGYHLNVGELGRLIAPLTNSSVRAELAKSLRGLGTVVLAPPDDPSTSDWLIDVPIMSDATNLVKYLMASSRGDAATFNIPSGTVLSLAWNDPFGVDVFDRMRASNNTGSAVLSAIGAMTPHVSPEVALLVMEAPSASVAYVRKANMTAMGGVFADLFRQGVIDGEGDVFVARDPALARAICSGLCSFSRYAIGLRDDGIVISESETLVRRLMVSDDAGSSLGSLVPAGGDGADGVAGSYGWADVASLIAAARVNGWMVTDRPVPGILRRYASMAYSVRSGEGKLSLRLRLDTGSTGSSRTDLTLAWQYPLRGDALTSTPVATVLNGRPAIIATTGTGRVLALDAEGTLQFEVTTGTQSPVGGVEIYDWYANRSPVVLQAAGSAIYAWSPSGNLLPSFPFVIDAPISAPITLTDIDGNSEPEILAPTIDARLHLINRDGRGVAGWPVYTDGKVVEKPAVSQSDGNWSVEVITEYATEVYDKLGQRLSSRPHLDDIPDDLDTLTTPNVPTIFDGSTPKLYGQFPLVIDIDGDGRMELFVVFDGQIRCYRLPSNRAE